MLLGSFSLFSKYAQYFHIMLDNFSLISKGAQYFSYRWVNFFCSQKTLMSISHMLAILFLISKGAQYILYPYRWELFYIPQETPIISHVRWFVDC
jgi:hypothetical protein